MTYHDDINRRVNRVLARSPIIDGHNDLAWELHDKFGLKAIDIDIAGEAGSPISTLQTDIRRLRLGHVGGQFWSVWIPSSVTGAEAVKLTLEQIDLVHGFVARNRDVLEMALTAADVIRICRQHRIASMIGIEGGHQIGESMGALRQFFALGARYMTLTHTSNNALADSATDNPRYHGLSSFGRDVIREMNRLGMMVDLAHVSPETMTQSIQLSKAPVIFSHSGARGVTDHPRNVPDDVLRLLIDHDGIVMVNFYSGYISRSYAKWLADRAAETARFNSPPYDGLYIGQPERAAAALSTWEKKNPKPVVVIKDVADHIDHIVALAGIDHVGIGSDFDGADALPVGLSSVADYPALFIELKSRGWDDKQLARLANGNLLRVMTEVEAVASKM